MGLLDSKSRIIDAVITTEGRRQMATGKMKVEYFTFTDGEVAYQSSSHLGGELKVVDDPTRTFYFESPMSLPSDRITFESDDTGMLRFYNHELNINNGNIRKFAPLTGSVYSGTVYFSEVLTGSAFASQVEGILSSSIDNYVYLRLLKTREKLFDDTFELSENEDTILIPRNSISKGTIPVNFVPDLEYDTKLSSQLNFKFLPPNIMGDNADNLFFTEKLDLKFIKGGKKDSRFDKTSYIGTYPTFLSGSLKKISFNMPVLSSKIVTQIFEMSADNKVRKLDIVEVGEQFIDPNDQNRKFMVYFVGKAFKKPNGNTGFLNIFTLWFVRDPK